MRLILARHGETDWNQAGRYQGHGDPSLNATGRAQAQTLARQLAELGVTELASSDLRRARETAHAVEAVTGLVARPCPDLREVDLGSWEGLTEAEVAASHPEELRAWKAGEDVARGGGETEAEAGYRFVGALDRWLSARPSSLPAVIAHGIVIRRALRLLAEQRRVDLPGPAPHLANGGWMEIDLS